MGTLYNKITVIRVELQDTSRQTHRQINERPLKVEKKSIYF